MKDVLTIILGGGKGERLYPLTADRAKPSCPFGGKYRLVDISISNSINSGFRRIYVLTQFNSASLHLHIGRTYNFDPFSRDFCEILAAEQTYHHEGWYNGTADAVRKNFQHFRVHNPNYYMILSGDQLYRMDLQDFMHKHIESKSEVSIAATLVTRKEADDLGILKIDGNGRIETFMEKPGPVENIEEFKVDQSMLSERDRKDEKYYLASMGIYIFNTNTMETVLDSDKKDFGKEIIPQAIGKFDVGAYHYQGYWEDIGTIRSFYEANINLGAPYPRFNLYDQANPIYTHRRDLPPTKINSSTLKDSIASEGSIITDAYVSRSLIGIRTIIESGATLEGVYSMGADYYETEEEKMKNASNNLPNYGIGEGSIIRNAIIDKNARIGKGCRIGVDNQDRKEGNYDGYVIRDGIITILKGSVIPDGASI